MHWKSVITQWKWILINYLKGIVKWAEPCRCDIRLFQGYFGTREWTLLEKNGDFDIWYSVATSGHKFSFQVYAMPFQWRLLIYIRKNLWLRVLVASKKQAPLKSYSLEIRINSVNQIHNISNISMLTRITDQNKYADQNYRLEDSVCIYSCLSNKKKLGT